MRASYLILLFPLGLGVGACKTTRAAAPRVHAPPHARSPAATSTDATDAVLTDELVVELAALQRSDAVALRDSVYRALYETRRAAVKPVTVGLAEYRAAYARYPRVRSMGQWLFRVGPTGSPKTQDLVRFYFDLNPDESVVWADALCGGLDRIGAAFTLKLAATLAGLQRSSGAVLYVARGDYRRARDLVLALRSSHRGAFGTEEVAFARRIAPGIHVADEPLPEPVPKTRPKHSFGSLRADAIAEALLEVQQGASPEQVRAAMRRRLAAYGISLAHPWLAQGKTVDDL